MVDIVGADESNAARVTTEGILLVGLCEEFNGSIIPLKDLTNVLEAHLKAHGGQGNLRIAIHYMDDKGKWIPWRGE